MNMLIIYNKSFLKKHLIMNNIWKKKKNLLYFFFLFLSLLIKFKGEQSINPTVTNNITSYQKINKFHSMRETPQFEINYNNMDNLLDLIFNVKMFITRGQYACNNIIGLLHQRLNVEHSSNLSLSSLTKKIHFSDSLNTGFRAVKLNVASTQPQTNPSEKEFFEQWLIGITDANGTFSIYSSTASMKLNLTYKLSQNTNNLRVLYYIKKNLNCGTVKIEKSTKSNNAYFIIRDFETIKRVILPIFDKYPLLTSKAFNYEKFKQAVLILDNTDLTKEQKNLELVSLNNIIMLPSTINYISSAWTIEGQVTIPKEDLNSNLVTSIMSKAWLIGFIEGDSVRNFYLRTKSNSIIPFLENADIVHGFRISQMPDPICLEAIRIILHIKTKVVFNKKHNYYILDTTNSRAIENIIKYFSSTMKGIKSVEYRIWARAYLKNKGNLTKLQAIYNRLR